MFSDYSGVVYQVDGIILVIRAEKSRWPVALSVKKKIPSHGDNPRGAIFKDRRCYLPGTYISGHGRIEREE
jgi:protein-tyrosine kinase